MTVDELIAEIYAANCAMIEVERLQVRTGNTDNSGNYQILKLRMGERAITFDNSAGNWAEKA